MAEENSDASQTKPNANADVVTTRVNVAFPFSAVRRSRANNSNGASRPYEPHAARASSTVVTRPTPVLSRPRW